MNWCKPNVVTLFQNDPSLVATKGFRLSAMTLRERLGSPGEEDQKPKMPNTEDRRGREEGSVEMRDTASFRRNPIW